MEYYGVTSSPLAVSSAVLVFRMWSTLYALSNLRLQRLTTLHQKILRLFASICNLLFGDICLYTTFFEEKFTQSVYHPFLKNLLTELTDCCCSHHAILRVLKSMAGLVNMVAVSAARVVAAYEYFLHKFFLRLNWLLGHVLARVFAHMLGQFEQNKH